ncbi:hypothetical protein V1460_26200 [Streptomyces sp. SCSIO 30461]
MAPSPPGHLDAPKARLLLHALPADGADRERVAGTFDRIAGGELAPA